MLPPFLGQTFKMEDHTIQYLPQRRKGRKEIKLPNLAFLASWREQFSGSLAARALYSFWSLSSGRSCWRLCRGCGSGRGNRFGVNPNLHPAVLFTPLGSAIVAYR